MVIDPWLEPYNGTTVSTRRFVAALEAAGHRVEVLAIGKGGHCAAQTASAITAFEQLSVPGFNRLINSMRAPLAKPDRARIRAAVARCDLVHVQFPFLLGYATMVEARRMGVPVVCSFHVQPENIMLNVGLRGETLRRLIYRLFVWAFYSRADLVIAPTPFAADLLLQHGVTRPIRVISNGVPAAFFARPRAPAAAPAPDGRIRILSVGRLAKEKSQETLLRAVAASAHRGAIDLTLAGAGPREDELKQLAARLGLEVHIGPITDAALLDHYAGAALFVHCGAVELEGMSVLEAMAMGLPILVSDSPDSALARLIPDAERRFHAQDPADLAAKIDGWLDRPAELAAEGESNWAFAEGFAHARSVAALIEAYETVAAAPGRLSAAR